MIEISSCFESLLKLRHFVPFKDNLKVMRLTFLMLSLVIFILSNNFIKVVCHDLFRFVCCGIEFELGNKNCNFYLFLYLIL